MKNEAARLEIEFLDNYLQNHSDDYSEESHTAMMMARDALGQEPCENAISRQAVDDAIYDYSRACDVDYAQIMEYIDKLPSVTPTQKWIPVSERMPEKNGNYLVTVESGDKTASIRYQMVEHYGSEWLHDGKKQKVIAWMPLPEPYKTEGEE